MTRHRLSRFEDLRSLQLMFWSYTLADRSAVPPQQWLGHRMPNLRSLSIIVGPTLSVGFSRTWSDVISSYPDFGFFYLPDLRESMVKPMPLLTTLKIDLKVRRGPYGYTRYENTWDLPDTWQVPVILFAEGSGLRRCSVEEIQWPQHLFPFFHSLVVFHYKGGTLLLDDVMLNKLVSSATALRSVWLEGDGFKVEDEGRYADHLQRRPYARLQHIAIGIASSSDRIELLHHLLQGGAIDVVVTLDGMRARNQFRASYTPSQLDLSRLPTVHHQLIIFKGSDSLSC